MEDFERLYRAYVDAPWTPAPVEDWERYYRLGDRRPPARCIHGLTLATCGICYFDGFRGGHE